MANEYYDHTTYPSTGASGSSSAMRAELNTIEAGFDKLPTLTGNAAKLVRINAGGTAQEASNVTLTDPATTATLTLADNSSLVTVGAYSVTWTATGATTLTLPTTGTLATLAGTETLSNKTLVAPALGTPASGNLANCTFPTLNQSTTGSAATLTTPRAIYGNNFDGSAALTQVIASTYGGTGNGFTKFTGATTAEKTYTLPDANATLLYSGGALGTPASGTVTNLTGTASININGTVGATTPTTGAFTTLSASGLAAFSNGMLLNAASQTVGGWVGATPIITDFGAARTSAYYTATAAGPVHQNVKGRGTAASPTTTSNADVLGTYSFAGYDTNNALQAAAAISCAQNGSATASGVPGRLDLYASDGTAVAVRASVSSTGVAVTGAISATTTITAATGAFATLSSTGNTTLGDAASDIILLNGVIGVGSQAPSALGAGIPTVSFKGTSSGTPSRGGALRFDSQSGTGGGASLYVDAGNLNIYTGATDSATAAARVRFHASGGVSINNTTDPGAGNLSVTGDISVSTKTPASASAAGVTGTITWDANYIYVCTATNTWKRVAIATW